MKPQLKLLLLVNSFFVFAGNLFAPFYALFVQSINLEIYHIGGIWSVFIFSSGILTLIISRYENHKKYADYFLILGFLFRAFGWLSYLFVERLWQLYLIQIIMAFGEAFGTPTFNFLYSSHLTKGEIATDWGINSAINAFIIGTASFIGGMIIQFFGFNALFMTMVGLALLSSGIAWKYKKKIC